MATSDMTPVSTNEEQASLLTNQISGSPRKIYFSTDLLYDVFKQVSLSTVGKVVVVTVVALLLYDLLIYLLASTSSRKRLLVTPWLVQVLANSWDDISQRGAFAR